MERRKFIGSLTGPVLTACAVCMGACSKGSSSPSSGNTATVTPPAGVNFTIDLRSSLLSVGSSVVQSGVIVVRLAASDDPGSFTAVQVSCTHEGTSINFNQAGNNFVCPNHGSTFTTNGAVTNGPAASALKKFTVTVSGNILTVTG
ncbi:MAG: Rieske (2Fe-2S) protein [Bacteroidota bacterium]|nr:Rieske (2Fe-2S) protein [Bacteroidota bacterium]